MNFGDLVIMMSKFGSKSGDFAQRGNKLIKEIKKQNLKNSILDFLN